MIGILTHHWAKTDKVDEARELLERNGEAQRKAPGFVNRQTLYALTDPTKITTVVVWTSNEIYDAWRASPARAAAMSGAEAVVQATGIRALRIGWHVANPANLYVEQPPK